ncbi:hypothetical protein N7457_007831 [Penicillium paradoxum]|uniref:uncharacterized protein n=1 Tax=Penicillium paradoxum TaxID=176176 RepID=UPI002546E0DF|nr:uncharacterized protein N7457_007831 [Penicillium paradoxum]KAJ5772935.1 hypothetical protein N7457_007831 [Penicillium paradoxum]
MKQTSTHSKPSPRVLTHNHYGVGWVCALPKEQTAAMAMLDEIHCDLPKPKDDTNAYTLGSIGGHNIVIACLPKGKVSASSAASVAIHMVRTFPSIKVGLMVGIGGGIPSKVRLGDVVISAPVDVYPGVVQWDLGKAEAYGNFKQTGVLNTLPNSLLTAMTKLESKHDMHASQISQYLNDMVERYPNLREKYTWSSSLRDPYIGQTSAHLRNSSHSVAIISWIWEIVLFHFLCLSGRAMLTRGSATTPMARTANSSLDNTDRGPGNIRVHYGLIASGDQVIKDAVVREKLNKSFDGHVLCIETGAAGLIDHFPCIVICGICNYADAQANADWEEYAAAIAAACAKEFLEFVQPSQFDGERSMKELRIMVGSFKDYFAVAESLD